MKAEFKIYKDNDGTGKTTIFSMNGRDSNGRKFNIVSKMRFCIKLGYSIYDLNDNFINPKSISKCK